VKGWLLRFARTARAGEPVRGRQIYILPTRYGVLFAVLVIAVFVGAMNYGNNLAFLLAFQLAAVGQITMHQTWRNLRGLRLAATPMGRVYAGEPARFAVRVETTDGRERPAVQIDGVVESALVDCRPDAEASGVLGVPTLCRGRAALGRLTLSTRYPLGLLRAWSYVDTDAVAIVYPRPALRCAIPADPTYGGAEQGSLGVGADDFVGLRGYRPGDAPSRLDWKTLARERGLHTRQFGGDRADRLWLSFDALEGMDTEQRLAMLCRGVLDAERGGRHYGLRLPGEVIEPGHGTRHAERCLTALALFGTSERS
jgi:uncharacterized protein (DUF58 family)